MLTSITIKAGDSAAFRFPVLEKKPNAEIWAEGGGTGGITAYWADYDVWVKAGNTASEEEFLTNRAPGVVPHRLMDLTGWTILAHMRDPDGTLVRTLDVRAEAPLDGGLVLVFQAADTQKLTPKTYQGQIQFTKATTVISSDVFNITVEGDVTYV